MLDQPGQAWTSALELAVILLHQAPLLQCRAQGFMLRGASKLDVLALPGQQHHGLLRQHLPAECHTLLAHIAWHWHQGVGVDGDLELTCMLRPLVLTMYVSMWYGGAGAGYVGKTCYA